MTVGIVIARAGSTRMPNKNGTLLCGVPLVGWSIIQSMTADKIDKTFLVTDSEEYCKIAEFYGATPIKRPTWDNMVQGGKSFLFGMEYIEKELGLEVDEVVYFMATSPLKMPGEVDKMIQAFRDSGADTMTTAAPIKETYVLKNCKGPYWDRFKTKSLGDFYFGKYQITDSYWKYSRMCGGWGIGKRYFLYNVWNTDPTMDYDCTSRKTDKKTKVALFPLQDWQTFEIDYPEDFDLCEILMEHFILRGEGSKVYGNEIISNGERLIMALGSRIGNINQLFAPGFVFGGDKWND